MLLGLLLLASTVGAVVEGAELGPVRGLGGGEPAQEATQYDRPVCLRNQTEVIYFPHETECDLFYACANGLLTLMECPPNTEFVPGADICDWIAEGGCTLGPATTDTTERTETTEAIDATETTEAIDTTETTEAIDTTETTEAIDTTETIATTSDSGGTADTDPYTDTTLDWSATPPRVA